MTTVLALSGRGGRLWAGIAIALLIVAAGVRFWGLETRVMHGDEAVHAFKYAEWIQGKYHYDIKDYHGPVLYFATWPLLRTLGVEDVAHMEAWQLRSVTAAVGVALVGLVLALRRVIGRGAALAGAAFMAVSPMMVFYSRYYVQEIILTASALAAIACILALLQPSDHSKPRRLWLYAALLGALFGVMHATKETYPITIVALVVATFAEWLFYLAPGESGPARRKAIKPIQVLKFSAAVLGVWIVVGAAGISSVGRDPAGVIESLRAWSAYAGRGTGVGEGSMHVQPWWFYAQRLLYWTPTVVTTYTEASIALLAALAILLAVLGKIASKHRRAIIFLTVYTTVVTLAYHAIPYKTPWCALQFWMPTIVLAGIGVAQMAAFLTKLPWIRAAWFAVILLCLGQLSWQMYKLNWVYPNGGAPPMNPWAYAHPVRDVREGGAEIERVHAANLSDESFVVAVVGPDLWPWPWYLRHESAGYWTTAAQVTVAPTIVIASEEDEPSINARWPDRYVERIFGLRADVRKVVFIERTAWVRYVNNRKKPGVQP